MKTRNCNADGSPAHTRRNWWDAWLLIGEMTIGLTVSIYLLVMEVLMPKSARNNPETILDNFKQQLYATWDVIPCYLRGVKGR